MADIDESMENAESARSEQRPAVYRDGRPLTAEDQALVEKYRSTFIGSYSHSLDGKGRLVVPQTFREGLGSNFCICPSLDMKSISLYTEIDWARRREHLDKLGVKSAVFAGFLQVFDQLSYRNQECDPQGRVLLPAKIRQLILKDHKDVEICGASDHIRICTDEDNKAKLQAVIDKADEFSKLYDELSRLLMDQ